MKVAVICISLMENLSQYEFNIWAFNTSKFLHSFFIPESIKFEENYPSQHTKLLEYVRIIEFFISQF